jgi:hypothetical protein
MSEEISNFNDKPNIVWTPEVVEWIVAWDDAVTAWLARGEAGAKWPGGKHNMLLLCKKVLALGLDEVGDKYAVLTIAFDELRRENVLSPPAED